MSVTENNEADSKAVYKYTVAIEGFGGDYACIPLTAEQADYWGKQGDLALAAHISIRGDEDEGVPSEFQLPDFRDEDWITGIDPDASVKLTVQEENGDYCFEKTSDDDDFHEILRFSHEIGPCNGAPEQPVAMYRTYLKGADVYEVTTSQPFNSDRLILVCAEVAGCGDVISTIEYETGEIEFVDGVDREKQPPVAFLRRK